MRKLLVAVIILFFQIIKANLVYSGWIEPIRISAGGYADPQVLAVADTIQVAAMLAGRNADEIVYFHSYDKGQSWSSPRVLSGDSCQALFPKIVVDGSRVMVIWRAVYNNAGPHDWNIAYRISNDCGLTWGPVANVLSPGLIFILYFAVSSDDDFTNITLQSRAGDSLVFYNSQSTDFGQSWTIPIPIFKAIQSGAPDQAQIGNDIHFVWDGRFNLASPYEVRYMHGIDDGIHWSENIALSDSDEFHSQFPHVTADNNRIIVSWMDYKYSPYLLTGDIFIRSKSDSASYWQNEIQVTANHFAIGANDVCFSNDTIQIVWEDARSGIVNKSIYYIKSTDNGATWNEPYWLDGTLDDSEYPVMANWDDNSYCVWQDGRTNPDTNYSGGLYLSRWDPEPDAITDDISLPTEPTLSAYPNPFNSATTITITGAGQAEIGIYDITGRLITTLHTIGGQALWDASAYSSGLYFARAAGEKASTLKLVLVK
jgi:hypothetical protein